MSAQRRRTHRDQRRRTLGQNFLHPQIARRLVAAAEFNPGDHVIEIGAGSGSLTLELAGSGVDLRAVERDSAWAAHIRRRLRHAGFRGVDVVSSDFLSLPLPKRPFRVFGSLPFGATTAILRRILDRPSLPLIRADVVVQWEVARKRTSAPPTTLLSTAWAPWWEFRLGERIPAAAFRPVPRVDGGLLTILRREPPVLPPNMAHAYADFVRRHWPFPETPSTPLRPGMRDHRANDLASSRA